MTTMVFDEIRDGITQISIKQTGVPLYDSFGNVGVLDSVKNGWKNHFFQKIFNVLGYAYDKE